MPLGSILQVGKAGISDGRNTGTNSAKRKRKEPAIKEGKVEESYELQVLASTMITFAGKWQPADMKQIQEEDPFCQGILATLEKDANIKRRFEIREWGVLFTSKGQVVIPKNMRQEMSKEVHDAEVAGHKGRDRTQATLEQFCWWNRMNQDVNQYCRSCPQCQKIKSSNQMPAGELQSLPIPQRRWASVSIV